MSVKHTVATRYGPPGKGAHAKADGSRRCADAGCTTILSTYNASPTCYLHTQPTLRHPLAAG